MYVQYIFKSFRGNWNTYPSIHRLGGKYTYPNSKGLYYPFLRIGDLFKNSLDNMGHQMIKEE